LNEYVAQCMLDFEDPALLLSWDDDTVALFVAGANLLGLIPAQPAWISTLPGAMTTTSLLNDIIDHLALVGGGKFGNECIAPNTLDQYANVMTRLLHIKGDAFVQACMANENVPVGSVIATTARATDRTTVVFNPCKRLAAPAPQLKVFA
ncbi:hypothetical protein B484DRAFT_328328, partial [Ochromonadaceae sp. CCMP2298]